MMHKKRIGMGLVGPDDYAWIRAGGSPLGAFSEKKAGI